MDLQAVGLNFHQVSLDGSYRETTNSTQRQDYEDHLLDNPVFNIVCDSSFDRVMRRSQCLEMKFHRMETLFPSEVQDKIVQKYDRHSDHMLTWHILALID